MFFLGSSQFENIAIIGVVATIFSSIVLGPRIVRRLRHLLRRIENADNLLFREQEQKIITENMSDGLVIQNQKGEITRFNSAALRILRLTEAELLGRSSLDPRWQSINPDGTPLEGKNHPAMVALTSGKKVNDQVMGLIFPNSERAWIQINSVPIESASGRIAITTFSDITNQVLLNADLKNIFNYSSDLLCILSSSGEIQRASPSFLKVFGYSETEMHQKNFRELIFGNGSQEIADRFGSLLSVQKTVSVEIQMVTHSGELKLIDWRCEQDPTNELRYIVGRDMTDMRKTELKNSQILKALGKVSLMTFSDLKGNILSVNETFCKTSGYEKHELLGKKLSIVNSGKHPKSYFENFWKKINNKQSWIGEFHNKKKNGDTYIVESFVTPIFGMDGVAEEILAIQFDITQRKYLEHQLQEAQEIAKIGSWSYDFKTKQQIWTREHYRIFEIEEPQSQDELFKLYRERIHPDDRAALDQIVENALQTGTDFSFNHRVFLDEGKRIKYVRGIGKISKDSDGRPISMSGTCQDLTEIVSLQEQNKFILDSMGIGIWRFNPNTKELFWDKSLYNLYGLSESNFSGHYQAWESTLAPKAKEKALKELNAALSGEQEFNTTFEIITPDGIKKFIGGRGTVVRDDVGRPIMMFGINWDRTKDVEIEEKLQLERTKSIHTAKLASLGEMSAGVAHEINNPLAIIVGSIGLIQKFKDDPLKFESKIAAMLRAIDRIVKIVSSLRRFSHTGEKTQFVEESLDTMIRESIAIAGARARIQDVSLTYSCQSDSQVFCNPSEIEQVLVNIINNAVDAAKITTARWVKISCFTRQNRAVIQIIDSGNSLTPAIEQKLFQPFFTTKAIGEGTGLGLSISKGILDNHNGTITLNRSVETTCFEIELPIHQNQICSA